MVIKLKAHTKKSSRYLADALFSNCLIRTKKNPKFIAKTANLSKSIKIFFFIISLFARNILAVTETERKTLILRKQKDRLVIV